MFKLLLYLHFSVHLPFMLRHFSISESFQSTTTRWCDPWPRLWPWSHVSECTIEWVQN